MTAGWCEGEIISDGTKGRFPINKTTKITSSRVKAANLKAKKEMRSSKNLEDTTSAKVEAEEDVVTTVTSEPTEVEIAPGTEATQAA